MERRDQLQCLRVSNNHDVITLLPDRGTFSCAYLMCCQTNIYRHVGIQLRLYPQGKLKIKHPTPYHGYWSQFRHDFIKKIRYKMKWAVCLPCNLVSSCFGHHRHNPLINHSCKEYMERLNSVSTELSRLTLEDLYTQLDQQHAL